MVTMQAGDIVIRGITESGFVLLEAEKPDARRGAV